MYVYLCIYNLYVALVCMSVHRNQLQSSCATSAHRNQLQGSYLLGVLRVMPANYVHNIHIYVDRKNDKYHYIRMLIFGHENCAPHIYRQAEIKLL